MLKSAEEDSQQSCNVFSFKLRSLNTENSKGKFKNEKWQERRGKDVLNCKGYVWLWEKGTLRQLW